MLVREGCLNELSLQQTRPNFRWKDQLWTQCQEQQLLVKLKNLQPARRAITFLATTHRCCSWSVTARLLKHLQRPRRRTEAIKPSFACDFALFGVSQLFSI